MFVVIWTILLFGLSAAGVSSYAFVAVQVVLDIVLLFKLKLVGS